MRKLAALVCALVMVPVAVAVAETPPYLVTGGGQVLASSEPSSEQGPGDTIAFVAGERERGPFGSLQVVNTSEAGAGQRPEIIFNGRVTCVEPGGENMARFGGVGRAPDGSEQPFTVDVTDGGEPTDGTGTDEVVLQFSAKPCEDGAEPLDNTTLARGNVKVDTANGGQ